MAGPRASQPETTVFLPVPAKYAPPSNFEPLELREDAIEAGFVGKLQRLHYTYRPDVCDRVSLERNFREKFNALNRVRLTDTEFARLLEEITTPDVFKASKMLRERNTLTRDDDTPGLSAHAQ
jgi:type I restriction enzyme, R subunit